MRLRLLRNFILLVSLTLLAIFVGYKLGASQVQVSLSSGRPTVTVLNRDVATNKNIDFKLFWQVWDEVSRKYVDKSKIDQEKMVYGAISGMVSSLGDPYTVFLPPKENLEVKSDLNGRFEGIGAQLGVKDNRIVVVAPLKGSPAERAGIKIGDWIIKVDGQETALWSLPEAVAKIRGEKGTTVTLNILHDKDTKPLDILIVRDTIKIESVEWKVMTATSSAVLKSYGAPAGVAYVRLSRFGDTTNQDWSKMVNEVTAKMAGDPKIKGIVFDLRNNPGGYLTDAVYVASEFLPEGVVVQQEYYTGEVSTYSVDRRGKFLTVPMVVLVNQGSASAAEILAGGLKVRGRAKIVGMQTYGKGSVQETTDVAGGGGLHVTVAKWLLPDGTWIQGKGLTPDVKIEQDDKDPTRDVQLEKAMEVLVTGN